MLASYTPTLQLAMPHQQHLPILLRLVQLMLTSIWMAYQTLNPFLSPEPRRFVQLLLTMTSLQLTRLLAIPAHCTS